LRENQTKVRIRVKDINDLPPKFDQSSYETTILEEDEVGLPKSILKVSIAIKKKISVNTASDKKRSINVIHGHILLILSLFLYVCTFLK